MHFHTFVLRLLDFFFHFNLVATDRHRHHKKKNSYQNYIKFQQWSLVIRIKIETLGGEIPSRKNNWETTISRVNHFGWFPLGENKWCSFGNFCLWSVFREHSKGPLQVEYYEKKWISPFFSIFHHVEFGLCEETESALYILEMKYPISIAITSTRLWTIIADFYLNWQKVKRHRLFSLVVPVFRLWPTSPVGFLWSKWSNKHWNKACAAKLLQWKLFSFSMCVSFILSFLFIFFSLHSVKIYFYEFYGCCHKTWTSFCYVASYRSTVRNAATVFSLFFEFD